MTAMIVCNFEHVQWRRARDDRLARGEGGPVQEDAEPHLRPEHRPLQHGSFVAPQHLGQPWAVELLRRVFVSFVWRIMNGFTCIRPSIRDA